MRDNDARPLTSALRLFGSIRIWASVIIGTCVAIAAAVVFGLSFTIDRDLIAAEAEITSIDCDETRRETACVEHAGATSCVATERAKCKLTLQYDGYETTLRQIFETDGTPSAGDLMNVFYKDEEPSEIVMKSLSDRDRMMMRMGSALVFVVSVVVVAINAVFANNRDFRSLQGGLGAIQAFGA